MQHVKKTVQYGEHSLTLETGKVARQADSVWLTMGNTVVLATVVADTSEAPAPKGFFPLTVHYIEKAYAAGRIPGGYFKREGRPSESEVLISRLIDRALRPLFPEGFENEVQIIVTVLSLDPKVSSDIPALIAASAAVAVAGIPFNGPVSAARVGYQSDGLYLLNPSNEQMVSSQLDLVVAGTHEAVLMVESAAKELSEKVMLGAVMFGHAQMQVVNDLIRSFADEARKTTWAWQPPSRNQLLDQRVAEAVLDNLTAAYKIHDKSARQAKVAELSAQVLAQLTGDGPDLPSATAVKESFHFLEEKIVRNNILANKLRIDGRDEATVRTITIETGILPRAHGSSLFTRGETQALVVATLGTGRDAQLIDALSGEYKQSFMLHYNFPPFSVGEIGMVGSPKRREIGHGRLAWRAMQAVLPDEKDFPYVIRVVSEITESNGSSSMATVCGASLSLMDAGVPIKAPVAGIAMGLVKEGDRFTVLTDILGDEDHLGDMDFKVAGTTEGITALQMDIKIEGITAEIMETALAQAKKGRLHILDIMNGVLGQSREKVSEYAPRILTIKIEADKIRDVIGKGGATIRALTEETGATIDIGDDGTITIASVNQAAGEAALARISAITSDIDVGGVYTGKVSRLADFGAFVMLPSGKEGLLHISQIRHERVEKVSDCVKEGDVVTIKVIEIDRQGRIRLSMKALVDGPKSEAKDSSLEQQQETT